MLKNAQRAGSACMRAWTRPMACATCRPFPGSSSVIQPTIASRSSANAGFGRGGGADPWGGREGRGGGASRLDMGEGVVESLVGVRRVKREPRIPVRLEGLLASGPRRSPPRDDGKLLEAPGTALRAGG